MSAVDETFFGCGFSEQSFQFLTLLVSGLIFSIFSSTLKT